MMGPWYGKECSPVCSTSHGLDPKIGKVKDKGRGDILEVPVDDAVVV